MMMSWFFSGNERMRLPVALANAFSTAGAATQMVGSPMPPQIARMLDHQLAPELELVLSGCLRELVDEAFQEDSVLVDVHAAPEARRDMRIVHRVVDHQVRHRIAERVLGALRHQTLERERVFAL